MCQRDLGELHKKLLEGYPEDIISELEPLALANQNSLSLIEMTLLANAYYSSTQYDKAKLTADIVIQRDNYQTVSSLRAMNILADIDIKQGNLEAAEKKAKQLILYESVSYEGVIIGKLLVAQTYAISNDLSTAIKILTDILDCCKDRDVSDEILAKLYANLGMYLGMAGSFHQSIEILQQAYTISAKINDAALNLNILHSLAVNYYELGDYDFAFDHFILTRVQATKLGNSTISTWIMATCTLGSMLVDQGRMEEGLKFINKALETAKTTPHRMQEATAMIYKAKALTILGQYENADTLYTDARKIAQDLNNMNLELLVDKGESLIKAKRGLIDDAISQREQVIAKKETLKREQSIIEDFGFIILCLLERDDFQRAEQYLVKMKQYIKSQEIPHADSWTQYIEALLLFHQENYGDTKKKLLSFVNSAETKTLKRHQILSYLKLVQITLLTAAFPGKDKNAELARAYNYAIRANAIAIETRDATLYLDGIIIQANIEIAQNLYEKALQTLLIGIEFAKKAILTNYLKTLQNRIDELKNIENLGITDRRGNILLQSLGDVLQIVDPTEKLGKKPIFSNILIYKLGENGPEVIWCEQQLSETVEVTCGAFYYAAIGQGQRYRIGMYGPLPFTQDDTSIALIYSIRIHDSLVIDPRLENFNYLLLVFVAQQGITHLINRKALESIIQEKLATITDLSNVSEQFFAQLREKVREKGF